ncbi:MAG: 4-hydroxythreonine-4-phosphate dehydrogenase PdxA, partial [Halalkalicoccus sp.]|nr:4-hydroxythreonine-4-phosphate dehydrogenase PdxA [Halalkalicoccus sp.]
MSTPTIGITMGDPAGIGPEIVVKGYRELRETADVLVIGDAEVVESACGICGSDLGVERIGSPAEASFERDRIPVLDLDNVADLERGIVQEAYGTASLEYIERAISLAQSGTIDAMVTAPINKQATELAGSEYAGHTGMLADYTDTETYSMMLIEGDLRVTHVSTHVPLREARDLVTEREVLETIRVTDEALRELGVEEPTVAVAGLNPHASDGGLLGSEDAAEIEPAVSHAREEGIDAFGPESPDTVYVQAARGAADCVGVGAEAAPEQRPQQDAAARDHQ